MNSTDGTNGAAQSAIGNPQSAIPKGLSAHFGNVRIPVHIIRKKARGKVQVWYRWRARDRRGAPHEVRRLDRKKALSLAYDFAKSLAEGRCTELAPADVASYRAGVANLGGTGDTVETATAGWAEIKRRLAGRGTPLEAVEMFLKARQAGAERVVRSWKVLLEELIAAKRLEGLSELYLRDLNVRVGRLAREVSTPVGETTAAQLGKWLDGVKGKAKTRRNYWGAVSAAVSFAKGKKYLPKDFDFTEVRGPRVKRTAVEVFNAQEMAALLAAAPAGIRPLLVLGGFAGLRTAEVLALRWEQVVFPTSDKEQGHIVVGEEGKTGRRLVPLLPNTALWLRTMAKPTGRVLTMGWNGVPKALVRLCRKVNAQYAEELSTTRVAWRRNGLRKSFVSYRCALVPDLAAVSIETGHSIAMLMKHYRKVVTPALASEWFAVTPYGMRDGIVQLNLWGRK